jgi:hypothetical protein
MYVLFLLIPWFLIKSSSVNCHRGTVVNTIDVCSYLEGESLEQSLLLNTASKIILANEDDKAVVPCRARDADTEIVLFIGRTYFKRRKVSTRMELILK